MDEKRHYLSGPTRVLVNHVPFFTKTFYGTVTGHISHQFSKEMSQKSEIVSLNMYRILVLCQLLGVSVLLSKSVYCFVISAHLFEEGPYRNA